MAKIVIIGAGLTGLSTAYHLEQKGFFDYKLFEKEDEIGGLCKSVTQDGFTFDFTGHFLHINNKYFEQSIQKIIGLEHFNKIRRRSFIYSHNTYTPYPYQINLYGLPTHVITECIQTFVNRKKERTAPKNYYQWVLRHFGKGLGKHFFFPYQKKIFDYDPKKLSHSWTGRFVPETSLLQIIQGSITKLDTAIGYNAYFFYPKKEGIFLLIKKLAQQLQQPIHTHFCAKKIHLKEKYILFENGHIETFDQLITTMPLNLLLKKLQETSATFLQQASKKLLCNSVLNFNIGIKKPHLTDKHWIYYPEQQIPFYRIGFPHNFSSSMSPSGYSSLYGEISYTKKSEAFAQKKLKDAIGMTKKLLGLHQQDIATEQILHLPYAYVIYNAWRDKYLPVIHTRLQEQDIYSIGRYGNWKYASMQEAFLDGKEIVEKLLIVPARKIAETKTYKKKPKKQKELQI